MGCFLNVSTTISAPLESGIEREVELKLKKTNKRKSLEFIASIELKSIE